jgi:DNA mismatch repair ATPase MutL
MGRAAMAACHMSVRIGDHLNHKQMKELLNGMSDLQSPWNCPHGRPTIVRLTNVTEFVHTSTP